MRTWTNRLLPLLFTTLLLLTSGCAPEPAAVTASTGPFPEPVYQWGATKGQTVTIWARGRELERVYMQRMFARYHALTGNTVEVKSIPSAEFVSVVEAALAGNGEQPDLILSYGGTNIENLHPDEHFYDFTDAPWVDDLTDMSINQTIYHGRVIGLPLWEASVSGMLYNKDLFQKLGLAVPQTQAQFMEVCAALLQAGITPVYLPFDTDTMMLYQFPLDTVVRTPKTLDGLNDGSLNFSDLPEMRDIVQWYRTMADQGYFGANYRKNGWDGMDKAMDGGEYAMMLCWDTWLYTDFTGDAAAFGLMPAFIGVPDGGTFEGPNLALTIVHKNAPNLETALDLVTFMADPYNYNVAFAGIYTAPVFKNQVASISTPQYVESERLIEENFHDSIAWLRIRGFSQSDASCIQAYMIGTPGYTLGQCLADMDRMRSERAFG